MSSSVVVIGKESVGKSRLVGSITGARAQSVNFAGYTLASRVYAGPPGSDWRFVDTPGIERALDARTTQVALDALAGEDRVLVVAQATHLDEDLAELLPLARGKRVAVVVTFWDKVAQNSRAREAVERLSRAFGLPFVTVDARNLTEADRAGALAAVDAAAAVPERLPVVRVGWRIEPRPTVLEDRWLGPILALALLVVPAVLTVWCANAFAGLAEPLVERLLAGPAATFAGWPSPLRDVLAGD
ncbi:MAG: FeoB small GTPase domain-containing protein [Dehalococcoidia bacterium]